MDRLVVKAVALSLEDIPRLKNIAVSEWDTRTMAIFGLRPVEALANSMKGSSESVAVFANDELVALWGHGYRDFIAGIGYAWLITTPAIEKYTYRFGKNSFRLIQYLMSIYSRVEVMVDAEFLVSIAWLERLGFQQHRSAIIQSNHPFIFLWKDRS